MALHLRLSPRDRFACRLRGLAFSFLVFAAIIAVAFSLNSTNTANPAVTTLDVNAYLGLWYQTYSDNIAIAVTQPGGQCVTAKYGSRPDGFLSVHNYDRLNSPTGTVDTIDGYAYPDGSKVAGQLSVHLEGTAFDAPYWVLALGPVVNGQYEWSIVSDNLSKFLFVLARNVNTYYAKYDVQVQAKLFSLGFTGTKAPIKTHQGSDCLYE